MIAALLFWKLIVAAVTISKNIKHLPKMTFPSKIRAAANISKNTVYEYTTKNRMNYSFSRNNIKNTLL